MCARLDSFQFLCFRLFSRLCWMWKIQLRYLFADELLKAGIRFNNENIVHKYVKKEDFFSLWQSKKRRKKNIFSYAFHSYRPQYERTNEIYQFVHIWVKFWNKLNILRCDANVGSSSKKWRASTASNISPFHVYTTTSFSTISRSPFTTFLSSLVTKPFNEMYCIYVNVVFVLVPLNCKNVSD